MGYRCIDLLITDIDLIKQRQELHIRLGPSIGDIIATPTIVCTVFAANYPSESSADNSHADYRPAPATVAIFKTPSTTLARERGERERERERLIGR